MIVAGYFQLDQVGKFSARILPGSLQMNRLEDYAIALASLEANVERLIVVGGSQFQDSSLQDLEQMRSALDAMQIYGDTEPTPEMDELARLTTELHIETLSLIEMVLAGDAGSREMNQTLLSFYSKSKQARLLHQEVNKQTLDQLRQTVLNQERIVSNLIFQFTLLGLLVLALVFTISYSLSRSISQPLINLRNAAIRVGKGQMDTQIPVVSNDEVGQLAASFNQMLASIRQAGEALRESEARYRYIFESAAVSIWEEDFSAIKMAIDSLKAQGVVDFAAYLEEHPDIVPKMAQTIQVIDINEATLSLYEAANKDELLGSLEKIIVPETQQIIRDEIVAIAAGQTYFEGETVNRTLSGRHIHVLLTMAIPGESKGFDSILIGILDISQRKAAEGAIRRSLEESQAMATISQALLSETHDLSSIFRLIVETARQIIPEATQAIIHLRSRVSPALEAVASAGPWKLDEPAPCLAVGQQVAENVAAQNQLINIADIHQKPNYLEEGLKPEFHSLLVVPVQSGESVLGTLSICSASINAFSPTDERLLAQLGRLAAVAIQNARLHADLQTQLDTLQKTQARLMQSEKLAAIGQLVAGVAHELNNPLTSVIVFAQLLQARALDETSKNYLDKIISEAERTGKIVRGLLEFARKHPPERRAVQIESLLDSVLELVGYELRSHNIEIIRKRSQDLPLIMADAYQIQQVFINIITNALQAMQALPQRGQLSISTQVATSIYTTVPGEAQPVIRILIQDNGPGIPVDLLPRIFDPFFTTKPVGSGTGLGLSICYGIVNEHGGHIWAESEPDAGATFIVEIPIYELHAPAAPKIMHTITPANQGRILVIDDEPLLLEALTSVLEQAGFQVDSVDKASRGLAYLSNQDYDLILCDIRMPEMNGIEFYQQVQKRYPHLIKRLVFSTGDSISPATQRFLEESDAPCLNKPFEIQNLLNLLNELITGDTSYLPS
ncbi:MAG: ATP-binding protein [Chloroflexota bacterium]